MKTNTILENILENIQNPFVDDSDYGLGRLLGYTLYGICVLTCVAVLPIVLLGWAVTKAVDKRLAR